MLPLFGSLSRAISASQVNNARHRRFSATGSSLCNLSTLEDRSMSPSLSPSDNSPNLLLPSHMPHANRRQRRASLVSWVLMSHDQPKRVWCKSNVIHRVIISVVLSLVIDLLLPFFCRMLLVLEKFRRTQCWKNWER